MKITCEVIKDLLPLYVENMLSDDSVSIVEEHIEQCQECKTNLKEMESGYPIPAYSDSSPLLKIKSNLRKKKIQAVILSALIAVIIFAITMLYLTSPEYHYYEDSSVSIYEVENGLLMAEFGDNVYGYSIDKQLTEDSTAYEYHITTWDSIWNRYIKKSNKNNIILNPNGEKIVAVYFYQAYGSEDRLIYGKDLHPDGGVKTLPRLSLSFYAFIALILSIICGVIMLIFHGNRKVFNSISKIFLLSSTYILAHLIVTGFTKKIFNVTKNLSAIFLLTILLYMALLVLVNLIKHYKVKK